MKNLVAINYSWKDNSHLLFARAEGEILEIFDYKNYPCHTAYSEIVAQSKAIKNSKFFSNFFEPFGLELRANQFEEIEFQDEKLKSLEAILNNLIASGRLLTIEDLIIPSNNKGFERCLQILIKGAIPYICKQKSSISFGTSVSFSRTIDDLYGFF